MSGFNDRSSFAAYTTRHGALAWHQTPLVMRPALLLPLVLAAPCAHTQYYTLQQSSAPYTELTAPTMCTFDENGFDELVELDGEDFTFFGQPYTGGEPYSVLIGDWGFLRIENSTSAVIIDGLFTELQPIDGTSSVSYAITGAAGAQRLTAQWTNWHLAEGPSENFTSFQISVEQASGVITIHTGPNSGGGLVFDDQTGPNCGIFRANSTFTQCLARFWLEADPMTPTVDMQANFDFDALHGFPLEGTVYRIAPAALTSIASSATQGFSAHVVGNELFVQLPEGYRNEPMEMIDACGRVVGQFRATAFESVQPVGDLRSGIYLLRSRVGRLRPTRLFIP